MTNPTPPNIPVPFSQEAEEATIGSILLNPSAFVTLSLFLKASDFFLLRNNYIWEAFGRLHERGSEIDYLLVIEELRDMGRLDGVGGDVYIIGLFRNTPTSVHAEAYGRLVERAAMRRRLIAVGDEIRGLGLNDGMTIEDAMMTAEERLSNVSKPVIGRSLHSLQESMSDYYKQIKNAAELLKQGKSVGIPTGFRDLDDYLYGLQRKSVYLVAAPTGGAKTSFLVNVGLNATRLGARVAIVSLEMAHEEISERLLSMETGIPALRLRSGDLVLDEWSLVAEAMERVNVLQTSIVDTSDLRGEPMTPAKMRTRLLRLVGEQGIDLILLDYMQLLWAGNGFEHKSPRDITRCSEMVKEIAKELNVPILAAAQYNRGYKTSRRPRKEDLWGGAGLEQNASCVMHLYDNEMQSNAKEIIIDKARFGGVTKNEGELFLGWNRTSTKFADWKYPVSKSHSTWQEEKTKNSR